MRKVARQAVLEQRPLIITAGGDDTVRDALFGMGDAGYFGDAALRERITFGILPLGTFNNFATSLGLPMDLEAAYINAHEGRLTLVDIGMADSTLFIESVGVGIDVTAWRVFPPEKPNLLRRLWDGGLAVARALTIFQPRRYSLVVDGVPRRVRAYNVTVANSSRFSAGLLIAPEALPDDGYLDLCIIPALSKLGFILAIPLVFLGKHTLLKGVHYSKVRDVRISAIKRFSVRVDNQVKQKLPIHVSLLPRLLPIRRP